MTLGGLLNGERPIVALDRLPSRVSAVLTVDGAVENHAQGQIRRKLGIDTHIDKRLFVQTGAGSKCCSPSQ